MPRNPFVSFSLLLMALLFAFAACSPQDEAANQSTMQATSGADATNTEAAAMATETTSLEGKTENDIAAQTTAATETSATETTSTATPEPLSSAYPGPTSSSPATPSAVVAPTAYDTIDSYLPPGDSEGTEGDDQVYIPIAGGSAITPSPQPTDTPTPVPTIDFGAVRADLEAQGQEIGFVKTGFHVTLPEDREVLDDWMTRLDAAGVPFFLKTVDNAEPLFKAQELMRKSGVPHVLVYRSTGSVPHYELAPEAAAQHHWQTQRDLFPPELDPSLVWIETLNEPDRTQSEWLAKFALETARLAMADGYRWAAFGWASGEPEPEHWRGPAMQEFLRLAGENPGNLAIALHEYSYTKNDIADQYPYKVGRFQSLFQIVDEFGIPRPTVLITEWGWEHADIPDVDKAIDDLKWASKLYAAYPEVKGAAIWNVGIGCCFGDISEQVQEIINPVTDLALQKYFAVPAEKQPVNPEQFKP
ncbi:MAG: hypothetical protein ACK2UG_08120 [Candidatus Promineifilaceae bacterium]|jgi:hypothetical protein